MPIADTRTAPAEYVAAVYEQIDATAEYMRAKAASDPEADRREAYRDTATKVVLDIITRMRHANAHRVAAASRTLRELCDAWLATNGSYDPDKPTVRGWIMDEMDRRAGETAVDTWLEAESRQGRNLDPYPYLACAIKARATV